jgi:hypothetical protein
MPPCQSRWRISASWKSWHRIDIDLRRNRDGRAAEGLRDKQYRITILLWTINVRRMARANF